MTINRQERPLVTFALFAYNQERYIREAVAGALAQTYEPLEIILSDDCSTDRTFEIMQEMVAAYEGPHRVRVIQNETNMGVTSHVLRRCQEAAGQIIIVAAGDDISVPTRTANHVAEYGDDSVWALSTTFDVIDEEGKVLSRKEAVPIGLRNGGRHKHFLRDCSHDYVVIQGSTASYRRELFDIEMPSGDILFSEDNLLNFLVYAMGKRVAFLDEALVLYRKHPLALSHKDKTSVSPVQSELNSHWSSKRGLNKAETFLWLSAKVGDRYVDVSALKKLLTEASEQLAWKNTGIVFRLSSLLSDFISGEHTLLKWKAVRLAGTFPNYQPKKLIKCLLKR